MKKYFYIGALGILLFELANIWFIMPFPGSQQYNTVHLAHFLYQWKWVIRGFFYLLMLLGFMRANTARRIVSVIVLLLCVSLPLLINLKLSASAMFSEMKCKSWADSAGNKINEDKLVIGVSINGQAKAYPIQLLAYHHRIFDTVGGKAIMVTYCSVCRTGRVFEPMVNGRQEAFTLVGMDHFNALFEDKTTKTWWRQVNGLAIAGELEGQSLPEVPFEQLSLKDWLAIYPEGKVLQPDADFAEQYAELNEYDRGCMDNHLEKTDTCSWKDKSWVLGVECGKTSKAYDWNLLKKKKYILDEINGKGIIIWTTANNDGYHAFYLPENLAVFGDFFPDTLRQQFDEQRLFDYTGRALAIFAYRQDKGSTDPQRFAGILAQLAHLPSGYRNRW